MALIKFNKQTAIYKKVLPDLTQDFYTLGVFSKNKIGFGAAYVATETNFIKTSDGTINTFFYKIGLILSTDENESCYLAGNPSIYAN